MGSYIKHTKIHIAGIPGGEQRKEAGRICEERMAKNIPE